jgi:hypothetical protein
MHGCPATGIDISPFSALLARGRVATSVDVERVRAYLEYDFTAQPHPGRQRAVLAKSEFAYARAVVQKMCDARRRPNRTLFQDMLADDVGDYDSEVVSLLSLAIASRDCATLERGTNPIWYRYPSLTSRRPRHVNLPTAAARWANTITTDLLSSPTILRKGHRLRVEDFTTLVSSGPAFDLCLTSPPYLNRLDYVVAHLPELSILQLIHPVNLNELRRDMIGTTKISRKTDDDVPKEWGGICHRTIRSIGSHPSYASRRYYYHTYYQYFDKLHRSLRTLRSMMRPSSKGIIVLQDSYYKDVQVPTAQICVEMMQSLSFTAAIVRTTSVRTNMGRISPTQTAYAPNKTLQECLVYFG